MTTSNPVPIANSDHFNLKANTSLTVTSSQGVLANDYDSTPLQVTGLPITTRQGTLTLYSTGAFSYTPKAGWVGTDSFIYSTSDGTSSTAAKVTLTVQNPTIAPYNIEVKFIDSSLSSTQKALFTSSANRWSEIITKDLPAVSVGGRMIDDLLINVNAIPIDGVTGILANGRPTTLRTDSYLPAVGELKIDSSDINRLEQNGTLDNVILHEMAHVLGFGSSTIWSKFNLVTGRGTNNPRFTGKSAIAEASKILGTTLTSVPLGMSSSHWRDSVFPNELMTEAPVLGINPISRVTIGALSDMGYGVNYAA